MSIGDALITPEELAMRWKISVSTLSSWRQKGTGPSFVRTGGTKKSVVRYRMEDVLKYETENLNKEGK